MSEISRRRLLLGLAGMMLPASTLAGQLLRLTPRQSAGPFYPVKLPLDDDNDLTEVTGRPGRALGQVTDLSGRILDVNGEPLRGLRIEIWQCDFNGRYRHPWDRGGDDPDVNFQGHGHTNTDALGRYRFRTIRPVPYPGRTPHIHIAVLPDGNRPFTTQLYVRGEPRNARDGLYRRIDPDRRHLVSADFLPAEDSDAELRADFDIVLGGMEGTPMT